MSLGAHAAHASDVELFTFTISHFSEKARWALDVEGIPYREHRLLPGLHPLVTRRLAAKSSVPLLSCQGRVVQGSGAILDVLPIWFGTTKLVPATLSPEQRQEITEWEELFDEAFGLGVQRLAFAELLQHPRTLVDFIAQDAPPWLRSVYRAGHGFVARTVRGMYTINARNVQRARLRFAAAMARTDARLADRPFLVGEQLTRADLGLASLLAPLCRPPEHLARWPEAVPSLEAFVEPYTGGPTWAWVRRLYRERRWNHKTALNDAR